MINRQCDIDSKGSKVITQLMIMGKPLVKATRVDLPPRVVVELELNNVNPPPDKFEEEIICEINCSQEANNVLFNSKCVATRLSELMTAYCL